MLDTTIRKQIQITQIRQKHNTICVGHHYTKTNTNNVNKTRQKHNTICVGHHYTKTNTNDVNKTKTQYNMCWTPLCENKYK